ncbi:hypothetical protein D3C85_1764070 [compost metagenome]
MASLLGAGCSAGLSLAAANLPYLAGGALYADGHSVEQSMPGSNPERDKMVSDAIAKLKQGRPAAKVRQ